MLCKSLRSTLNALLQATMLRIRATNRTIVDYVRYARFSQMQALASLFACGQPLKTTHRVVFLTLSFKSLLLSVEKQKRTSKHLSVISTGETGICEIAQRVSLLTKAERQPGDDRVHAAGGTVRRIVQNPVSKHRETGICSCLLQSNLCWQFLCFAKAFGQPLKTTHRVVFLTLSFKSLLLSIEKQKRTSKHLSVLFGGETGI